MLVAQNYVMGTSKKDGIANSFNIYKVIAESDSPSVLLSKMADMIVPLRTEMIKAKTDNVEEKDSDEVYQNYLHYFVKNKFWEDR